MKYEANIAIRSLVITMNHVNLG